MPAATPRPGHREAAGAGERAGSALRLPFRHDEATGDEGQARERDVVRRPKPFVFALALGLLAGITSLVPYLGPFLGAIPAVLIGFADSPEKGLLVAAAYLLISNVILNFVFPKVMGDAVKLPPILVIVAFLAGFSLAGILGMFVAIPVAATIRIIYDHVHPRLFDPPAPPEAAAETTA